MSIVLVFVIILLVEKSLSLPVILIAVIELAIFINLGLPHYLGETLPFIAPICISTIQLGATVDYAILMTTRYKQERAAGKDKREAVTIALSTSIPSIVTSGFALFSGGSRWVERRVEFMILEFVGRVLLNVLKAMVWMALLMFRCVLGLAKLTLLVFGLVARVFLVLARAAVD